MRTAQSGLYLVQLAPVLVASSTILRFVSSSDIFSGETHPSFDWFATEKWLTAPTARSFHRIGNRMICGDCHNRLSHGRLYTSTHLIKTASSNISPSPKINTYKSDDRRMQGRSPPKTMVISIAKSWVDSTQKSGRRTIRYVCRNDLYVVVCWWKCYWRRCSLRLSRARTEPSSMAND